MFHPDANTLTADQSVFTYLMTNIIIWVGLEKLFKENEGATVLVLIKMQKQHEW